MDKEWDGNWRKERRTIKGKMKSNMVREIGFLSREIKQ